MRNSSLDEFLDNGATDSGATDDTKTDNGATDDTKTDDTKTDGAVTDAGSEPESVDPAVSTYDWTPSGAECDGCGAVVERRWRDDPGLVCPDCKDW